MNSKIYKKYLTDMRKSIEIMENNVSDTDVLKFYAGKISVLNSKLMSILVKTE